MDYSKYLTALAKKKNVGNKTDEQTRALNSIFYSADQARAMATNSATALLVDDKTIETTHAFTPKDGVTSTGADVPDYPRFDVIEMNAKATLESNGYPVGQRVLKSDLSEIKAYKSKSKAYYREHGSREMTLVTFVPKGDHIEVHSDNENVMPDTVLFTLVVETYGEKVALNVDNALLLLEFIADLQRDKANKTVTFAHSKSLRPLYVKSDDALFITTPVRKAN